MNKEELNCKQNYFSGWIFSLMKIVDYHFFSSVKNSQPAVVEFLHNVS